MIASNLHPSPYFGLCAYLWLSPTKKTSFPAEQLNPVTICSIAFNSGNKQNITFISLSPSPSSFLRSREGVSTHHQFISHNLPFYLSLSLSLSLSLVFVVVVYFLSFCLSLWFHMSIFLLILFQSVCVFILALF